MRDLHHLSGLELRQECLLELEFYQHVKSPSDCIQSQLARDADALELVLGAVFQCGSLTRSPPTSAETTRNRSLDPGRLDSDCLRVANNRRNELNQRPGNATIQLGEPSLGSKVRPCVLSLPISGVL